MIVKMFERYLYNLCPFAFVDLQFQVVCLQLIWSINKILYYYLIFCQRHFEYVYMKARKLINTNYYSDCMIYWYKYCYYFEICKVHIYVCWYFILKIEYIASFESKTQFSNKEKIFNTVGTEIRFVYRMSVLGVQTPSNF